MTTVAGQGIGGTVDRNDGVPMHDYFQSLMAHCTAEWRPVVGHEGKYEVSSTGNVRAVGYIKTDAYGRRRQRVGRIMKEWRMPAGYRAVTLCRSGKPMNFLAHRLVAEAFIGAHGGRVVDHIDCNKWNNAASNLRYASVSQNGLHRDARKYKWLGTRPNGKRWQAALRWRGKNIFSPCFDTREEALAARIVMEKTIYGAHAPERAPCQP